MAETSGVLPSVLMAIFCDLADLLNNNEMAMKMIADTNRRRITLDLVGDKIVDSKQEPGSLTEKTPGIFPVRI